MISDPIVQWVLTAVFAATGGYAMVRMFIDRAPLMIIGHLFHLLMSAAMIAMCWPWGVVLPALPQVLLFIVATAWFLVLLGLQVFRRIPRRFLGGHSAWHQFAHALMMLAMVWMFVAMSCGGAGNGQASHHSATLPVWAALTGVVVTAALLVAGVIFLVELVLCLRGRTVWLGHTGDVASGALMSFGMAAMCWPMITG